MKRILLITAILLASTLSAQAAVELDADTNGATDVGKGGTNAVTLTDGGVLLGSGTGAITPMAVLADGEMIVGDGTTDPVAESGATLRTSIGVAIGTNVQAYDADLTTYAGITPSANVQTLLGAATYQAMIDLFEAGDYSPTGAISLTGASSVAIGAATGASLDLTGDLDVGGSVNIDPADDGEVAFIPATAGESQWWIGPNHNADASDNDAFEIRQSTTPGTNVKATISTAGLLTVSDIATGANTISSTEIATIVDSIVWNAGDMLPDGTQCAAASSVQINSGPYQYTIVCADNDASTLYGSVTMPDSWDASNVTFELAYLQSAADTGVLNGDVTIQCRGAGEVVNNTWESEVATDDAAVTGSNAIDHLTSGNVSGTCVAGDTLYWRWQMDATGTTTAVATLNFLTMKMEYVSNVGD